MSQDRLVHMANQIADAFKALPEAEAAAATEDHLRKFWDPRMRAKLLTVLAAGGDGLDPVARRAAEGLKASSAARP